VDYRKLGGIRDRCSCSQIRNGSDGSGSGLADGSGSGLEISVFILPLLDREIRDR